MPNFVTNLSRLLADALRWILYIVPVAGGLVIAYHAVLMKFAEGEQLQISRHKQAIRNTLVYTAIAFSASSIVSLIITYFR